MTRFTSILVANRGEIACRVIRSAKAEGYRAIAVYSEADAGAPHVQMADDCVCIGPGPVNESYLVTENILEAARSTGANAIHPGYGFLSENADFARACQDAGLVFIGPSPEAIQLMGNKAAAKTRMLEAGVPCVPGYEGEDQSNEALIQAAQNIELPIMVKAAAGGGGRGMRLVEERSELANALDLARAEALSAFGNGELILEQAILRPRHVEIQVFGDSLGNIIHLAERDCSVQRRHQKVIEEAPCPVMTDTLREKMGAAAVAAAQSIHYCGAGTVEFLLDENGQFFFLEMNTRLQVEHPVTELITNLDLVALQIHVAQGEPLGIAQRDIQLSGHAIEVRLYTEDPIQDFMPTSGKVDLWSAPHGIGVRVDHGISTGQIISPFYDPMVAKIIATGATREIARTRLINALSSTVLFGPKHNRDFLVKCLQKQTFASGEATTAFITEEFSDGEIADKAPSFVQSATAAVIEINLEYQQCLESAVIVAPQLRNWASAGALVSRKQYEHDGALHDLSVIPQGSNRYRVVSGENSCEINVVNITDDSATVQVDGRQSSVRYLLAAPGKLHLCIDGYAATYTDLIVRDGKAESNQGGSTIIAPMHGLLLEVRVTPGDTVAAGQTLAVLEAMKMHYEIEATCSGEVTEVIATAGNQVAADEVLIEIDFEIEREKEE
ncbi:MAG: acetyl-CoA carboxylase biotin carboxylase subunit [Halioglobus sp.]